MSHRIARGTRLVPVVLACGVLAAGAVQAGGHEPARAATRADALVFTSNLSSAQAVPMPANPTSIERGQVVARFRPDLSAVDVALRLDDPSDVIAVHFHCGRPGEGGPVAFGLIQPGSFSFEGNVARGTLTNADWTGSDCSGAIGRSVSNIAALALAMRDGLIYLNVHTNSNPPGEVRGQMLEHDR